MSRKSWSLVALFVVLSLMLGACQQPTAVPETEEAPAEAEEEAAPESGEEAEPVTITFWTHTHPPLVDQVEKMIEEYEEMHPNVTVEYQVIPNNEFGDKMITSFSTGTAPDIINMDNNKMTSIYMPKELVVPVDAQALGYDSVEDLRDAYVPGAFGGAEYEGEIYGIPSEFNVTAFAINTEHFEEAGLDPNDPPETWEEVGEMGQELVVRDEDGTLKRRGFDFLYLHRGWYHNQFGTLLLQTGGRLVSPDGQEAMIDEPEAVEALEIWYDLVHEYEVSDPNVATREATVPYIDFVDGSMSMSLYNPWGMAFITEETPTYNNYKIVPLPQHDPDNPAAPFYAYYWAVNAECEHKEEAFKFIQYMASKPGEWLENVNFIQPKKGWDELPEAEAIPFSSVWREQMEVGEFMPVTPHADEVDDIVKDAIDKSLLEEVPPQEVFDEAAVNIEEVLQE